MTRLFHVYTAFFCLALAQAAGAENSPAEEEAKAKTPQKSDNTESSRQKSLSGYGDLDQFGSGEGVAGQVRRGDRTVETRHDLNFLADRWKPYFDWKRELQDDHGLAFSFNLWLVAQHATDTIEDRKDNALGGVFRFQGLWTFFNRGGKNSGRIEWRVERRNGIGNIIPPSQLANNIGVYALDTGFPYNDKFNWDISVLNYTQTFGDGGSGFAVGRLAFNSYLDATPFQGLDGGFLNRGLWLNPTLPTVGIGALGAVGRWSVTDHIRIGAQIYDGAAQNGSWEWDSWRENKYVTALDLSWAPSPEDRKNKNIQLTYWAKDSLDQLSEPSSGNGWAMSGIWQFGKWLPFVRYGKSNGRSVRSQQSAAIGFRLQRDFDERLQMGFVWSEPSDKKDAPPRDDEYALEVSYLYQLSSNLSLTPDIQLVIDPADNPDEDKVWVFGLKLIMSL